jgi:hypothetical protein
MIHGQTHTPALPVTDYQDAIAGALAWLGDRYLLARPVNAQPVRARAVSGRVRAEGFSWQRERDSHRRYRQWLRQSSSSRAS